MTLVATTAAGGRGGAVRRGRLGGLARRARPVGGGRRQRDLVERPAPSLRGSETAGCGRRRRWAGTRGTGAFVSLVIRPLSRSQS